MKVVALAYNFASLGNQSKKHPFFFFKNPDSIIGPGDTIKIPKRWHVWPEVELALRIGGDEYFDAVAVANDVTAMNVEGRNVHLALSKGMDTFLPMSEWVEDFSLANIFQSCGMYTTVNDRRVQTGELRDMTWKPIKAYRYINDYMLWEPGDILLMGTCYHEHYPLRDGDKIFMDIDDGRDPGEAFSVGSLNNKVIEV